MSYDRWLLGAADESAAERYLPDDYVPETITYVVWWASELENCEDSLHIEVDNTPDSREWARRIAMDDMKNDDDIPADAVITDIWEWD